MNIIELKKQVDKIQDFVTSLDKDGSVNLDLGNHALDLDVGCPVMLNLKVNIAKAMRDAVTKLLARDIDRNGVS